MRPIAATLAGLFLILAASLTAPHPAAAAIIGVTTTADVIAVDGACSLREAVIAANTNSPVDTCPAGTGSGLDFDNIRLPAGTYVLAIPGAGEDAAATGDLDLLQRVSIDGPFDGSDVLIDAAGLDRAFDVHPSAGFVAFGHVTIANGAGGEDGGAIRLADTGSVDESGCTGILFAHLFQTVVRDSAADRGGGVFVGECGNLEGEWSSIVDNRATAHGGGVAVDGFGSAQFINATISGNVAAGLGGGIWGQQVIGGGLFFTTAAHNHASQGGGIALEAPGPIEFTIARSIVAQNGGGDCLFETGDEADPHYSLDSDGTCGDGPGVLTAQDPMLLPRDTDPVAYRLDEESPAIDAAGPQQCGAPEIQDDQYGNPRPLDGDGDGEAECDIGSYEAPEIAAQPTPTPTDGGGVALPDTATSPRQQRLAAPFAWIAGLLGFAILLHGRRRATRRPS